MVQPGPTNLSIVVIRYLLCIITPSGSFTDIVCIVYMASPWTIIEVMCLFCVFIGAFFGNTMLFYIVLKNRNLQTKGNVFILNLAIADLLVAFVNLPVTIVTVIAEDWILGRTVCLISGFITLLTFVASCMALSMISINRYHAIVHWTSYENTYTRRKCVLYVCITWGITIALSVPPFFGWAEFSYDPGQSYCFAEWTVSKSYTIFMISACLCGPLAVMSYCYVKIIRFHKESGRDVVRASMSTHGQIADRHGKAIYVRKSPED